MNLYQFNRLKVGDKIEVTKWFITQWSEADRIMTIKQILPEGRFEGYLICQDSKFGNWNVTREWTLRKVNK